MKIILLGAPGSGKGTISEHIIANHNFIHLSTGNIFRKRMDEKGLYWEELNNYMLKGKLVPDDLVNKIVKSELLNYSPKQSYILDGYPRTIEQAEFLSTITDVDCAIYLDVPETVLEKRLTGRRICTQCKKIYNVYFSPPKNDGICDIENAVLSQRKDDDPTVIKERLQLYKESTMPLIDYYANKNLLVTIFGDKSKESINKEVDELIAKFSK